MTQPIDDGGPVFASELAPNMRSGYPVGDQQSRRTDSMKRVKSFTDHRLCWAVVGRAGAMHMWCGPCLSYGGLELHSRSPMYESQKVSHTNCWLLNGDCYHDGSSLWWEESGRFTVAHAFYDRSDDGIFWQLERMYRERLGAEEDAAERDALAAQAWGDGP